MMQRQAIPTITFLFTGLLGCGGLEAPDSALPETSAPTSQGTSINDVAVVDALAVRPELPPVDHSINRRPCGDATIAVVDDERGATYAFCGLGNDDGVALMEILPTDSAPSLLDDNTTALALFERVLPSTVVAPEWVREALSAAKPNLQHGVFEHESTVAFAHTGSCSDAQGFFDYGRNSAWPAVYRTVANFGGQGSNYQLRDCVDEHEFLHQGVTWVQRTASAYPRTASGACLGAFEVRSCGGYTLMQFWSKASVNSGSWGVVASYWVPSGGRAHLRWYSNSQYSCHPSRDRDNFRVTSNSQPNANHHMIAAFVGRARDINTYTCRIDPR